MKKKVLKIIQDSLKRYINGRDFIKDISNIWVIYRYLRKENLELGVCNNLSEYNIDPKTNAVVTVLLTAKENYKNTRIGYWCDTPLDIFLKDTSNKEVKDLILQTFDYRIQKLQKIIEKYIIYEKATR